jgi:hypothetical protein
MKENYQDFYRRASEAHNFVIATLPTLGPKANLSDLADLLLSLKKSSDLLDDARKEIDKVMRAVEAIFCKLAVTSNMTEPVRTDYCTATPKLKMVASIPSIKTEPEKYAQLMRYLKIPEHLWSTAGGVNGEYQSAKVALHWPGICDLLTERARLGEPMPPGIDPAKVTTNYSVRLTQRKEILSAIEFEKQQTMF